jgi:hypothetical protein
MNFPLQAAPAKVASRYRLIADAVSYKPLAKALVLYKSRIMSLSTIIDKTSIETKAQEYDATYDPRYMHSARLMAHEQKSNLATTNLELFIGSKI